VIAVGWVWGTPCNMLGETCAVVVCIQGTLMHPDVCKGCGGMACALAYRKACSMQSTLGGAVLGQLSECDLLR